MTPDHRNKVELNLSSDCSLCTVSASLHGNRPVKFGMILIRIGYYSTVRDVSCACLALYRLGSRHLLRLVKCYLYFFFKS